MNSVNKVEKQGKEFNIINIKQNNIEATFIDYGATLISLKTPDKNGVLEDVIMSYESIESYIENDCYLNAIVGPIAGRIKNAEYQINNKTYHLEKNFFDNENLHSGSEGFSFKTFDFTLLEEADQTILTFTIKKEKESSNFPGLVEVSVIYTVKDSILQMEYIGKTDEDTLLNLTNHAYFNLSGNMNQTIMNHELQINSTKAMVLDSNNVPVDIEDISNTFLDFTTKKPIKDNFYDGIYQSNTNGIDHPYIVDHIGFDFTQATLYDPKSSRMMEVKTTYPSIVVYTHNYPDDRPLAHNTTIEKHLGICFEAQNHPNGINIPNIESSILRKEDTYYHKTLYKFTVKEG